MKKYNLTSASEGGFTLIEILIATVLLAFITFGVVSVTEDSINTMERTTEVNENNLQIETALSRFEWDFSQIYSPLYFSTTMNLNQNQNNNAMNPGGNNTTASESENENTENQTGNEFNPHLQAYYESLIQRFERNEHFAAVSQEGLPIPRFYAPEKNVLEFFTSSNRRKRENQKQSHFAWVRYSLADQNFDSSQERNPNIPSSVKSLVRYVAPEDPYNEKRIDIEDAERVKGAVLLENVESLEFQYWDYNRKRWETSLRTIRNGENLIRGIKILVTWYDSTGNKRSVERIFRNHWPMVAPQDQTTTTNRRSSNNSANNTQGNENEGEEIEEN